MTDQAPKTGQHGVIITQRDVFNRVEKLDEKMDLLTTAVSDLANIHKRLDAQHERQNGHSERIRIAEGKLKAQEVIIGIMTAVIVAAVIALLVK